MPCITLTFGREAIAKRASEWIKALAAGRDRAPRCNAPNKSGNPCKRLRMKGGKHCPMHLHGAERTAIDLARLKRAKRLANSSNAEHRKRSLATISAVERRRLHLHWRHQNPDAPGTTCILPPADERRLRKHLRQVHNLDIDTYQHAALEPQRGLSARAIDRIRYAGVLEISQRITATSAGNRIRAAIRDDVRWFTKHGW